MGSKRNTTFYSNNSSNRQSSNSGNMSNNSNINSSNSTNNIVYQNNDGNSNSSSHSLKHNSTKDKISRRSNKNRLSIVFDSSNSDNITKINLSSFNNSVLRKYRDTYKIKTKSNYTREDLLNAVTKHWNSQELSEKDIITHFIYTVRNHGNLLKLPLNSIPKNSTPRNKTSSNTN